MPHDNLISGIAHIGIRVKELSAARAFYERFGFEFTLGPVGPEPVAMMKHPAGIEINFILNSADPVAHNQLMDLAHKHAGYTHVALRVTSLDKVIEMLAAANIEITGGPVRYPYGARSLFVRDPDRNVLELYEPPAKSPNA